MDKLKHLSFPLSDHPTHYIAALDDATRPDCTHVAIELVSSTLIRLLWMQLVASILRPVGIKSAVFETRVGKLAVTCLKYQGEHFLRSDEETSPDETPYDCLSLGELVKLGGYATDDVLKAYFPRARNDTKVYAVEIHVQRFAMSLRIYFLGQILSIETNSFNLDIIVEEFLRRNVQRFQTRYLKKSR